MSKRSRKASRKRKRLKQKAADITEAGARNSKKDLGAIQSAIRAMFGTLTPSQREEMAHEINKALKAEGAKVRVKPKEERS